MLTNLFPPSLLSPAQVREIRQFMEAAGEGPGADLYRLATGHTNCYPYPGAAPTPFSLLPTLPARES